MHKMEIEEMTTKPLCHHCRRDRNDLSCMDCPNYGRRALYESLEEGLIGSIAGLFALIVFVYLYGAVS